MIPSVSDDAEHWDNAQPADLKRTRRVRQSSDNPQSIDRLPPNAPDCERCILGCILLSPDVCMPESIEALKDNGQEFYDLKHMTIWDCLVDMYDKQIPIEVISLMEELKKKEMLEQVGGLSYLSCLPDDVPSTSNLSYYLDLIVEKYVLRRAIQVCTEVVGRVYDYTGEVDQLMDEIERDMIGIRDRRATTQLLDIKTLIRANIQQIEDYSQRQGMITGIATGFTDFDKMTSGLQPSEMIVIAARPSMGKSSLAMNISDNIAVNQNVPVGVFSLEMSAQSLSLRMLCSRARVNLRDVREGFLAERDYPKLMGAADKIMNAPIYIDDAGGLTVMQLRAKARRMVQRWGVKLLIVDYLQLLRSTNKRVKSRQEEISDISGGLKALAKELAIPVVVLSQLNRELERDKSRKPRLSDLRESGAIEQDADVVAFLYRVWLENEDEEANWYEPDAIPINLLIGKQRNGPTGDVNLTFLKSYTRFESAAKVSDEDVPPQSRTDSGLGSG